MEGPEAPDGCPWDENLTWASHAGLAFCRWAAVLGLHGGAAEWHHAWDGVLPWGSGTEEVVLGFSHAGLPCIEGQGTHSYEVRSNSHAATLPRHGKPSQLHWKLQAKGCMHVHNVPQHTCTPLATCQSDFRGCVASQADHLQNGQQNVKSRGITDHDCISCVPEGLLWPVGADEASQMQQARCT